MYPKRIALLAVLSIVVGSLPGNWALAQADQALVLRVYEVGDLVMNVRDYEYPGSEFGTSNTRTTGLTGGGGGGLGGGMGGGGQFQFGGGGRPAVPASAATSTTMDDLINVIYSVVATETWSENGGSDAEARPFGNSLVVSQTPEVHAQIEQLLKQLRAGSGERRSVAIDARWLLLSSEQLALLVKQGDDGSLVNPEVLQEFTQLPSTIRMRTSCFSGQLVYVVSGTKRNIVTGFIPVVGSLDDGSGVERLASITETAKFRFVANDKIHVENPQSGVGYQPLVEKPNAGALLEIRPTLVSGSKTAIVDLKATVTGSATAVGDPRQPNHLLPEIDRVAILSQELATTLRVPLSEPVLVGGMTAAPAVEAEGEEQLQLYLVLEVR